MKSFTRAWKPKVTIIKEAMNLKTHDFDEFIGSLIAHKGMIKKLEVEDSSIKKRYFNSKIHEW